MGAIYGWGWVCSFEFGCYEPITNLTFDEETKTADEYLVVASESHLKSLLIKSDQSFNLIKLAQGQGLGKVLSNPQMISLTKMVYFAIQMDIDNSQSNVNPSPPLSE